MSSTIDLGGVPTGAFEPTPAHQLLHRFAGSWRGATRLWLEPGGVPGETLTELHAELILGGRWLRLAYRGVACGRPHAGEMWLGCHDGGCEYQLAWVDSFHTGTAIMLSTGAFDGGAVVDVLGSYASGAERWGWRTRMHSPAPAELALESFNISPAGKEDLAIATLLTRWA